MKWWTLPGLILLLLSGWIVGYWAGYSVAEEKVIIKCNYAIYNVTNQCNYAMDNLTNHCIGQIESLYERLTEIYNQKLNLNFGDFTNE